MRIAVWHDLPPGGARRSILQLTSGLAEQHSLSVFQPDPGQGLAMHSSTSGIPTTVIPFQPRKHQRFALYWNDWLSFQDLRELEAAERKLGQRLHSEPYDAVLCSTLRWGHAPALLQHLNGEGIYYCHEPPRRFTEPWCRPEAAPLTRYERMRLAWRWPARKLLDGWIRRQDIERVRSAGLVLTNSDYSARRIRSIYGREAQVSYLGVDPERFSPGETPTQPDRVISVGALEAHKGFDFLIQALAEVPSAHRPQLEIVSLGGHPGMPNHLQVLASRLNVPVKIHLGVSDLELISLYRSSSLFLFGARFEPFGLVVLEAMACGLPVVAVAEGGVVESVEDGRTGFLVPRDPQVFADRVSALLTNPNLRRDMGARARERTLEAWTWEHATRNLEEHLMRATDAR